MTEKELYKKAIRQNLNDPTGLTPEQVRSAGAKRKYGYVRTSAWKIAAAAAAAVLVIGAGIFFATGHGSRIETASVPQDIAASGSDTSATDISRPKVVDESEPQEPEVKDKNAEYYRSFWSRIKAASSKYRTLCNNYEGEGFRINAERLYSFAEDQVALPDSGVNAADSISEFFAAADAEYLGYTDGYDSTVDPAVSAMMTDCGQGFVSISPRTYNTSAAYLWADYTVFEGSAYLRLHQVVYAASGKDSGLCHYYKVTSPDGHYPYFEGSTALAPDWDTSTSSRSTIIPASEKTAPQTVKNCKAESADGRVSYLFDLDMTGERPTVKLHDLELPEGVSITEGHIDLYIWTPYKWGKEYAPDYILDLTSCFGADGTCTVDFNRLGIGEAVSKMDHFRISASFNTTEHTAKYYEQFGKFYAYTVDASVITDEGKNRINEFAAGDHDDS
ncbi:MAG: hypothetical protein IKP47_06750 [Ruminococcus sp.]|nr:hypothetical protein [Ruminococcus sp.]